MREVSSRVREICAASRRASGKRPKVGWRGGVLFVGRPRSRCPRVARVGVPAVRDYRLMRFVSSWERRLCVCGLWRGGCEKSGEIWSEQGAE